MSYIIIWRNSHRDPHIDIDSKGFKEEYMSFEDAKKQLKKLKKTKMKTNQVLGILIIKYTN
jgi:hypothetical protein